MGHGHGVGGSQVVGRYRKCRKLRYWYQESARCDHTHAARPAVDPHLARPAAPSRTIQPASALTRTGKLGPRHICTLTVALTMCPHTFRPLPHAVHDRTLGPKLIHSHRAGTRPCAWPRASASPPELPRSASNWPLPHHSAPGQCSTSPPQPGAALRLIAPPLFGAALVHACLCTSLHRCTPRTAPLSMRSAAPCARRSAYRAHGGWGSAHAPNRQVTGFGKGRFRLSAPILLRCPRRPGCGCSAAGGGGPSVSARQDVRSS